MSKKRTVEAFCDEDCIRAIVHCVVDFIQDGDKRVMLIKKTKDGLKIATTKKELEKMLKG